MKMKKYVTPELDVVELNMNATILSGSYGDSDQPGGGGTPLPGGDDDDPV